MKLVKIKPPHITDCSYCKSEGRQWRAVWRVTQDNLTACEGHKPELSKHAEHHNKLDS